MILEGDAAFAALRDLAADLPRDAWRAPAHPAFDRLRRAWGQPAARTPLELAVLLRQALGLEASRRQTTSVSLALAPDSPLQTFEAWGGAGLDAERLAGGWLVTNCAWRPNWAASGGSPDAFAVAEQLRPGAALAACAGDPFLAQLGYSTYQSPGQRAAVRAALTTPPGATLAVSLATGEGKSLIFQLAARLGFAGDDPRTPGLTVVVVPTVALAIDHENAAVEQGLSAPIAYRGGQESDNQALIAQIDADAQVLCVASPEAICGPLRRAITAAATRGRLRALVVDEAHLIDGWGTGFRTEFQTLSGLRHQWVLAAPPTTAARTLLLSATLTASTLEMLQTLFSGPGDFQTISALRLRAEPDYWSVACTSEVDREIQVIDALRHVPRPAILYVTRVVDAKAWRDRLADLGFSHVELVHGETSGGERDRILKAWRLGDVDLVVATSAFGLGIDYRHVRSVLHACIPESLDRFYQEVGRGGRDGRGCLSLTFHTQGDQSIAEHVGKTLVISIDRGRQRWMSMFAQRIPTDTKDTYILPLDVAPSYEPEDIDMRGERNSDWNARVLTLMARARMIELQGAPPAGLVGRHEIVRVLRQEHSREAAWRCFVEPVRADLMAGSETNLTRMREVLSSGRCPAPLLLDLYSAGPDAHACSRCEECRADATARRPERPRAEPATPWPPPRALEAHMAGLLDAKGRQVVWYDPARADRTFRRRAGDILRALYAGGVCNVALIDAPFVLAETLREAARDLPIFFTQVGRLTQRRLPQGASLVVCGPANGLESLDLASRPLERAEFLWLPQGQEDPSRPGVPLASTYATGTSFEAFYRSICV
jgi:superfamily II DNA/RNA helicase